LTREPEAVFWVFIFFVLLTQPESRAARLAVDAALQRAAGRADAFTPGPALKFFRWQQQLE
jgi:hypothetical protein